MLNTDINIIGTVDFQLREVIFAALLLLLENDDSYSKVLTPEQLYKGRDFCYELEQQLRQEITYEA